MQDKVVKLLLAISDGDGEEAALVLAGMGRTRSTPMTRPPSGRPPHLVSEAASAGLTSRPTVLVELSRLSVCGLRAGGEMSMIGKAAVNLDQATMHPDRNFADGCVARQRERDPKKGSRSRQAGWWPRSR